MKRFDPKKFIVTPLTSVREAIKVIDENKQGIALITESDGKLLGTLTDGDIRRFMLNRKSLDNPSRDAMYSFPTVLSIDAPMEEIYRFFEMNTIRQLPLVDKNGIVKSLIVRDNQIAAKGPKTAVIMAGGEGRRLHPITENIPKPMILIKGRPILEYVIEKLKKHGVQEVILAVNYKANIITEHFGDGSKFDIRISYIHEEKKLGTVGALSLLDVLPTYPILVTNGDLLTDIDFGIFYKFHIDHHSLLTVASIQYNINIPYGVIEHAGPFVLDVTEKPTHTFLCNAGIYIIDPYALSLIPRNEYYDVTSLIKNLLYKGLAVHSFPIHEDWIDIGQKKDLLKVDDSYVRSFEADAK